ncbi:hypothetical protein NEOLEDRAFT_1052492, partial [Neolentinus lepideus HHB14362 ss-1]
RILLNNQLQTQASGSVLTWEIQASGPAHMSYWTAIARIDGVEYGRGVGPSRRAAQDSAATYVLQAIK